MAAAQAAEPEYIQCDHIFAKGRYRGYRCTGVGNYNGKCSTHRYKGRPPGVPVTPPRYQKEGPPPASPQRMPQSPQYDQYPQEEFMYERYQPAPMRGEGYDVPVIIDKREGETDMTTYIVRIEYGKENMGDLIEKLFKNNGIYEYFIGKILGKELAITETEERIGVNLKIKHVGQIKVNKEKLVNSNISIYKKQ